MWLVLMIFIKMHCSVWRIKVHLHDLSQTLAGALIGVVFAALWVILEPHLITPESLSAVNDVLFYIGLSSESETSPSLILRGLIAVLAVAVIFSYRSVPAERIGQLADNTNYKAI